MLANLLPMVADETHDGVVCKAKVVQLAEHITNKTSFANMNSHPWINFCEDNRGVWIGKYVREELLGKTFTWKLTDAREFGKNVVRLSYFPDDPFIGSDPEYLHPELAHPLYDGIIVFDNPDCSIEEGIEFAKTVRNDIE